MRAAEACQLRQLSQVLDNVLHPQLKRRPQTADDLSEQPVHGPGRRARPGATGRSKGAAAPATWARLPTTPICQRAGVLRGTSAPWRAARLTGRRLLPDLLLIPPTSTLLSAVPRTVDLGPRVPTTSWAWTT